MVEGDDTLEVALEQSIEEGVERLERTWPALLSTGFVGGVDLSIGVLALLIVRDATGSRQLGALAFSIGFIALVLAKSELFTENFLVPVAALLARRAGLLQIVRLWAGTLVMNLVGGWIMMGIIMGAVPRLQQTATVLEVGRHYPTLGIGWTTFASAILAGAVMTLMTWMERGNRSMLAKLTAAIAAAFVLAGTPALHSIVTSLEMFAALHVGASFGYADWAGVLGWSILGNMIGGIGLVSLFRFIQVGRAKLEQEQATAG